MLYLKRKVKKCKFKEMEELYGFVVKLSKSKGPIDVKKITICDSVLINKYAKKQLDKKFSKMYKKIYSFLISDEDSEEGVKACLGEIEKAKAVLFNKYKEFIKNKLYKEYLAKIVLTENEFRNKYMEKQYYSNLINKAYNSYYQQEEEIKGRSR